VGVQKREGTHQEDECSAILSVGEVQNICPQSITAGEAVLDRL
jgi:hypothetical protein